MNKMKDFPGLVTAGVWSLVIVHFVLVRVHRVNGLPDSLVKADGAAALYIGAAAVVAVLAGFSGVIIVFGLTPGVAALQQMREAGGDRLRANWVSLVSTPIAAALLYLLAATLATAGKPHAAGWPFEVASAFTLVGALRTMWLFKRLAHKDLAPHSANGATASSLALVEDAERRRSVGG
ncbi:MAG: hypothetical protein ACJ72L_21185 [Marmoricola sp.]